MFEYIKNVKGLNMRGVLICILLIFLLSCKKEDKDVYIPVDNFKVIDAFSNLLESNTEIFEQELLLSNEGDLLIINSQYEYDNKIKRFDLNLKDQINYDEYSLVGFRSEVLFNGDFLQFVCNVFKQEETKQIKINLNAYLPQKKNGALSGVNVIYWLLVPKVLDKSKVDVETKINYNTLSEFKIEMVYGNYNGLANINNIEENTKLSIMSDTEYLPSIKMSFEYAEGIKYIYNRRPIFILEDKVYFYPDIVTGVPPYPNDGKENYTLIEGKFDLNSNKMNFTFSKITSFDSNINSFTGVKL